KNVYIQVGLMTPVAAGNGTNTQLTTFSNPIKSSVLSSGTLYGSGSRTGKFGTQTDGTGTNGVVTSAELLDGQAGSYRTGNPNNNGGVRTIRMAWRTRATNEMPNTRTYPQPGPYYGVRSDVLQLSG